MHVMYTVHTPHVHSHHIQLLGKRFGWRNFIRPILVIMRQRGRLCDEHLRNTLTAIGQSVPTPTNTLSWAKEKMGAEFRDMHLYLTYLLCGFNEWKRKHPMEYQRAVAVAPHNTDVRALFNFFEVSIPITVDFVEHAHYRNVDQLLYVLARTIVLLDTQHRTGYRRCLLQFLKDLLQLPQELQHILLKNFNSLCGVDIEHMHGMLAGIIPTVHKKESEQQVVYDRIVCYDNDLTHMLNIVRQSTMRVDLFQC